MLDHLVVNVIRADSRTMRFPNIIQQLSASLYCVLAYRRQYCNRTALDDQRLREVSTMQFLSAGKRAGDGVRIRGRHVGFQLIY